MKKTTDLKSIGNVKKMVDLKKKYFEVAARIVGNLYPNL